jgi:exopolyphosphatase/guanosine-5'-triphosphate,3'-diphosphate pyrophosphatase
MLKLSRNWRNRSVEFAAIDLGSNSFHMILAKVNNGQISIIDRLKEPVRLGFGLQSDGELDDLSQKRALDCLERFHQRIKHLPAANVRAVGTRTLRQARNAKGFLRKAEHTLGFDIQIVSGHEEARLVYQGVAFGLEDDHQTRLVIDIGGGSTEIIVGEDFTPITMESLGLGCVSITKRFFSDGKISKSQIKAADIYCQQKLEPFYSQFRRATWERAIGCSGSIKSIASVLEAINGHPAITADGLDMIIDECLQAKKIDSLNLPGLSNQRQPVFIGGLIVLRSVMNALSLTQLEASPWALREGVLYDMLGYDTLSDMRERSVKELTRRFHTDQKHAEQTDKAAQKILAQISEHLTLESPWSRYLQWACWLQEVGLDINHDRFHLHGGYIVENSHLAGFGFDEQRRLAYLVRNQRKKPDWTGLQTLPDEEHADFALVLHVFRLACVLTRARNDIEHIGWSLSLKNDTLHFKAPDEWWRSHPLVSNELLSEVNSMKKSPFKLKVHSPFAEDDEQNS